MSVFVTKRSSTFKVYIFPLIMRHSFNFVEITTRDAVHIQQRPVNQTSFHSSPYI